MSELVSRRNALRLLGVGGLGAGAVLVGLPGCGVYEAEDGEAFAPWSFPGDDRVPERVAARAAILASSPHNTQPWAIGITPTSLALRARLDRSVGTMDGLLREMHIGLGCAVENMVIAARAMGRAPAVALMPDPADTPLVARIDLAPAAPEESALYEAIANRHTNRGTYVDAVAAPGLEQALRTLVDDPAVSLRFLSSGDERARFRDETIAATVAICDDREMAEDSDRWYRHTDEDIAQYRDGTTLDATGLGAATRTLGKTFARPSLASTNQYWIDGTKDRQTTGSAFVILSSSRASTRVDQLKVGRIYQRLHLWAASQRLAMQPLNQLAERQDREEAHGLEPRSTRFLDGLVGAERRAQMLFRIGYAWDKAFASPRRPLAWVTT